MMLPVLMRFNGRPEVSENGNILYVFDELAVGMKPQASSSLAEECRTLVQDQRSRQAEHTKTMPQLPRFAVEQEWTFSQYPESALLTVLFFATINFGLSWWLFKHIATIAVLGQFSLLIDCLLGYGFLFLIVPFVRVFFNKFMNLGIRKRNAEYRENARLLEKPNASLQEKLKDASDFARRAEEEKKQETAEIAYTTEQDSLEQSLQVAAKVGC